MYVACMQFWHYFRIIVALKLLVGNKNHKYSTDLGENTIIYYAVCNSRTIKNSFHIGPSAGVGTANENTKELYHLMNDDEKENFLKIIKDNGYEWDDDKKELLKVLKKISSN